MIEISCPEPDDTRAFASRLAALIRPDDVIVLAGKLGSGKTLFVGGLAAGLGVEESVVSPSFILARQYESGFIRLVHADIYRLRSLNEVEDLDLLGLASGGVLVIEWGDAIESTLPADHLRVNIAVEENDDRHLVLEPFGSWVDRDWESVL